MRVLSTIGFLTLAAAMQAQEPIKLTPGMQAPKIEVGGWAKYDAPVAKPGRFRVVEFWATWCGPCKTSIPHLTKLAKDYKDKVDFVGVSVFERGENTTDMVKKFVAEYGDKMDYRVAFDTPTNTMAETWMNASEQPGIPTAFIVDDKNTVMWVGHPMSMDKALADAVAGKLDVNAEKAKFVAEVNGRRAEMKTQNDIRAAVKLHREGKTAEADAALAEIAKRGKTEASSVRMQRLMAIYKPGSAESNAIVDELMKDDEHGTTSVAQFAMMLSAPQRSQEDRDHAKKVGERIMGQNKDAIALYYVGVAYRQLGDKDASAKAFDAASAAAENDARVKGDASFLEAVKQQKAQLNSAGGPPAPAKAGSGSGR
ncbi:MAG: TlpA disulfide reductase family protein [Fimbriimonas sp.]